MKNRKTAVRLSLTKCLARLLAAVLLISMMPLAGMAPGLLKCEPLAAYAASNPTSGECGDSASWSFSKKTGTLTISGSGEMWDWEDPLDEEAEYFAEWLGYYNDVIKTITIKSGITGLGAYTFAECEALTSVSIPNTVRYIGEGAFQDCVSLKSITIPGSVTAIDEYAFAFCESLQNFTVPASVTSIGSTAFLCCMSADRIAVASGNPNYKTVDGILFTKDGKTLVTCPPGKKDHIYQVPAGTVRIEDFAFFYNPNIRVVSIPEGTEYIGVYAFNNDEKLFRIYLPGSMQNIMEGAFDSCPAMSDVYYAYDDGPRAMMNVYLSGNDPLNKAEWHYYASPEDMLIAPFEDVPKKSWFTEHVIWAAVNDITSGTSDVTFSPNANCERAQMVTFLWRAAGMPEPKSMDLPFTDVKPDAYYAKAVAWAVENNITQGTTKETFSPKAEVKRGQTVTFLYRWANPDWDAANKEDEIETPEMGDDPAEPAALNPFDDIKGDEYYAKAVLWAVQNNITQGVEAKKFGPDQNCTRAQIVTFLHRAVGDESKPAK